MNLGYSGGSTQAVFFFACDSYTHKQSPPTPLPERKERKGVKGSLFSNTAAITKHVQLKGAFNEHPLSNNSYGNVRRGLAVFVLTAQGGGGTANVFYFSTN